jgi:hypothetical protein
MPQELGKRGPWSAEERDYISNHYSSTPYKEIAQTLNRDPLTVKNYIRNKLKRNPRITTQAYKQFDGATDIANSIVWRELENQFTEEELGQFIYHWNRIIGQFKDDVLPTEELQIVDLCRIEILINRSLKIQKDTLNSLNDKQKDLVQARDDNKSIDEIQMIEGQLTYTKAAYESLNKEYHSLLQRKTSMLQEMKATRKERIQRIESSKQTLLGWISEMMTNNKLRKDFGEYIEKMRIAVDLEELRLMQPHKYADGLEDLPILSAESLERLDKKEAEDELKDNQ